MAFLLLHALVEGTLLAALLVGVWEWESMTVRDRWPRWSPLALISGAPAALLITSLWGGFRVPIAIFSISLAAVWLLVSSSLWRWVGTAAVLASTFSQSLYMYGPSARTEINVLVIVGATLLMAATAKHTRRFSYSLALYLASVGSGIAVVGIDHDPAHDMVVSLSAAGLLAVYILGRANRERTQQNNVYRAEHDALTDAFTRYGQETWLRHLGAERAEGLVVGCDLDDFKWLNDTWGHDAGDRLLRAFADRLRSEMRVQDALVRPGGDEFVAWIPGATTDDAPALVQRLHAAVTAAAYDLFPDESVRLGVSMGWALGPLDEETARASDQALLLAKHHGKNRVHPVVGEAPPEEGREVPDHFDQGQLRWLTEAAQLLWADLPTGAVLTNSEGRIVAANQTYERLTGRTWTELAGRKPGVNSDGKTAPSVYQNLWGTLSQGQPWHGCLRNRRPDGTVWLAQECISPIRVGRQIIGYWAEVAQGASVSGPGPDIPLPVRSRGRSCKTDRNLLNVDLGVVFQPIMDLSSGSVLGYEALIRPKRNGEPLSPQKFFAEAAAAGAEVEADGACLSAIRSALSDTVIWPPAQHLFINVRTSMLNRHAIFREHIQSLAAVVPWGQIVVEVSERRIQELENWGGIARHYPNVIFAQDDVGAGEADLARLVRLPSKWVKIDISLVSRVATDVSTRRLVTALTQWAHGTGARVIAEGVETVAQQLVLRESRVDAGQGFLWGRPSGLLMIPSVSRIADPDAAATAKAIVPHLQGKTRAAIEISESVRH